jgi:Apoptosis regulator proteins, Bcl-2 family
MVRYEQLVQTGNIAKQLADDIVQYVTVSPVPPVTCRYAETMRRVVDEASLRHKSEFENIIREVGVRNKSQPVDATMCQQTFEAVANELFNDGHYNWGRIAMLYAFAAWLAKHPSDQPSAGGNDEVALAVAEAAGVYVTRRLCTWICQQGGWVSHFQICC